VFAAREFCGEECFDEVWIVEDGGSGAELFGQETAGVVEDYACGGGLG
jgi:hypothetical protein